MKALMFLVIIANIILLLWEYRSGAFTPATPAPTQEAPDQEPILLLSEVKVTTPEIADTVPPLLEKQAEITLPDEQVIPEKIDEKLAPRCYEIGPLAQAKDVQSLATGIMAGYALKTIDKNGQIPNRYNVLSRTNSLNEAEVIIKQLKNQGITDFFLRRTQTGSEEISLGVFSREERAQTLQKQMLAFGIDADIAIEYKTKIQKYLLIKLEADQLDALESLQKNYPTLSVNEVANDNKLCW